MKKVFVILSFVFLVLSPRAEAVGGFLLELATPNYNGVPGEVIDIQGTLTNFFLSPGDFEILAGTNVSFSHTGTVSISADSTFPVPASYDTSYQFTPLTTLFSSLEALAPGDSIDITFGAFQTGPTFNVSGDVIRYGFHYSSTLVVDGGAETFPVEASPFSVYITAEKMVSSNDGNGSSAPVPEPMTLTLLGIGLLGIAYKKRKI